MSKFLPDGRVVGPERNGRKPLPVVEISIRIVAPVIPDRGGLRHLRARNHDFAAFDLRIEIVGRNQPLPLSETQPSV